MSVVSRIALALLLILVGVVSTTERSFSQTDSSTFVINLRDTEIQIFSEQVSAMTGRTLVLDPNVRGKVTVISSEPLDKNEIWALYQSVLRVNGFAAVRSGQAWRVVPQANATQGGATIDKTGTPDSQDFVTRLIRLRNVKSAEAVRVLKPLVASYGILEALDKPNAVVITDSAENVRRVESLAISLDAGETAGYQSFRLRYANAGNAASVLTDIIGDAIRVSVEERSNTLLVKGAPEQVSQAREIIAGLDQPGEGATTTKIIRLRYADAEAVIGTLRGLIGDGESQATNPVAQSLGDSGSQSSNDGGNDLASRILGGNAQGASIASSGNNQFGSQQRKPLTATRAAATGFATRGLAVETSPDINAIVVRGSPSAVAQIEELVAGLDIRRPQVMIEAAIVEISGDIADQFGIQLGVGGAAVPGRLAATSFSNNGQALGQILQILGYPGGVGLTTDGGSVGVKIGDDFSILVQALGQSSKANLMSTPSLTTLDNQPAEIVVGQNVPFRTGSYGTSGNTLQPFTTISRENVGITMRVVPRINDGDVIRLEITQEVSSLVNANVPGAADLITNRRSIQTTVLADDGGTIVLGGLITNDQVSSNAKVPVLGDVPVLGRLFRSDKKANTRRTLYVFLRPTILRDRLDVGRAAETKYRRMKQVEAETQDPAETFRAAPIESYQAEPAPLRPQKPRVQTTKKLPLEIEGIY